MVSPGLRFGEAGVFSFVVLFFVFVVVGANREIPKLLPMGMADVGRYSVKMCFLLDL